MRIGGTDVHIDSRQSNEKKNFLPLAIDHSNFQIWYAECRNRKRERHREKPINENPIYSNVNRSRLVRIYQLKIAFFNILFIINVVLLLRNAQYIFQMIIK